MKTKKSVTIIRATTGQVDLAAPLFDQYRQFYQQPSDVAAAARFLNERLRRRESVVFLATRNGMAVGFMQLYPLFSSLTFAPLWILNDLFVAPAARKQGVASQLMAAARQLARESGAQGLMLETAIDNRAAQALYKKLGWKRDEEFDRYFLQVEK